MVFPSNYLQSKITALNKNRVKNSPGLVNCSVSAPFSCYLIGRESFLIPCGESLLKHNCQILGIISTGRSIESWAHTQNILIVPPTADIREFLTQQPFDYLFSISNSVILPPEIIKLPRRGAINCHDALLPKYGGLNAPAWAIFHREKIHGVTWHQITTTIDGGDIFKQSSFELADNETTFSLSIRCYAEILKLFDQLIEELIDGEVVLTQQNLAERSYFSRGHKPSPGCILSWTLDAESIHAMVRALTFGDYENHIGLPKLTIANQAIILTSTEVLSELSQFPPGTIVAIESDWLTVATRSYDLRITGIYALDGSPLSIAELVSKFHWQIGDQLTDIDREITNQIAQFETSLVKHESFWVERLAKLNPLPIPLATISSVSARTSQRQEWSCPPMLNDFFAQHQAAFSEGNFVLVAIVAFLARISQQNSFDIGWRSAELDRRLTGLLDLFVDTVPCRIDLHPDLSFAKNFAAISQQVATSQQRQTYGRDVLLRYPELKPLAKLDAQERLPVSIALVADLENYQGSSTHGLTFVITDRGDKLSCDYDPDLFDRQSITQMLTQLNVWIERIIDDPDRSIGSLSLLSDRDWQRLSIEWNDTARSYPSTQCIHQVFEAQVELHPNTVAVAFERQQLTYRELNQRANQLAHYLHSLGIKPDTLVGISIERSIEMVVGILGILKAGGAYVPLDPTYPPERLALMIEDAAISVLVTQAKLVEQLPVNQARVVCIDRDLPQIDPHSSTQNLTTGVQPHNLAYAIYTSGSTGIPKGVLIEHRSLVNYATAAATEYQVTSVDRILQFTSLNFDISAEEIYTCLAAGATLVLRTPETLEIGTFLRHCREWQISIVSLPTAYWHELTIRLETEKLELPPDLRLVVIGGEQIAPARYRAWQQAVGTRVQLINTYGPTEATISALWADLSELDLNLAIPIGRPLPNVQVYILDANLQPVPIGVPGELHIGGVGLARGYLHRPDLTAAKFIPHPFSQVSGELLYQTGDLVRYRADGNIDFLGRIDRQVKIRGFRIELGEIEAVLDRHRSIVQTVVMVREDRPGDRQLVAYCVVDGDNPPPKISDLRNFIAQQVPNYLVPAMFVLLPSLPMTPNGKVDLRALPTPIHTREELADTFVAPHNEIELQLTEIWQRVLGIESIGIQDNFFELGGHSLLAIQLFHEIEKIWDKSLPLATLFQAQTIETLADLLRQSGNTPCCSPLVLIRSGQNTQPPLFFIHAIGGNILEYYPLANYLGDEQSIYGLQSQGLDGQKQPLHRVEEMASLYIQELLTVQPDGPYLILGYSFGGTIAFEIAQQLYAQGKEVAWLGLLDSDAPTLTKVRPPLAKSIQIHLHNLWQLKGQERRQYIRDRINYRFKNVDPQESLINSLAQLTPITPQFLRIIDTNLQAGRDYSPQTYPGNVSLFRCQVQTLEQSIHPALGWDDLVLGTLEIDRIDGSHQGMLKEPNVRMVAKKIKLSLARAQSVLNYTDNKIKNRSIEN